MLDINLIRKNPDLVKEGIRKKNVDPKFVDKFLRLDETWRNKVTILDHLKSEQNNLNKELWKHRTKDSLSRAQVLKKRVSQVEAEVRGAQDKRDEILRQFPNLPFEDVPIGKDDSENKVIREVGEKPKFDFKPKTYLELGESLNLINVKKASEVSGSRFGYLLGDAALLEFALVDLAFKATLKKNFIPVVPPVMVKPSVMVGMGKIKFTETGEAFYLPKDNLYLVGSAEHTLGPLHLNYIFEEKDLPRRYVGFSTCFRREAGSYGKDTKGILRVHQFDKVELFSFAKPDESNKEHEFLLSIQEKLMELLEIPYRVIEICTGDMGWTDAKQYDLEAWLPGQGEYRETNSASNTTDFQASGINAKYKTKDGKKEYVHMLNATAFAIGRTVIAILENYQTKKGTVKIPKVLQEYVGKKEISG